MSVMTRNALWFVMAASVLLAILSVQTWGHVWTYGEFIGPVEVWAVRGPDMHNVSGIGDGTVLLFGALLTFVLAVYAWVAPVSRRAAGAGIAIAGFAMGAIALYDCAHVGGVDLGRWSGFVPGGPWVRLTIVPYLAAANALIVGLAGLLALLLPDEKKPGDDRNSIERTIRIGVTTQRTLQVIVWLSAALAAVAFVPWLDVHTFHALVRYTSVTVGLGDATLLGLLALGCALLALQMLRDPTELAWALLVVVAGATFVVIGHDLTDASADCRASITTYLGFLSNPGCVAGNTDMLSNGLAFLWCSMVLSLFTLLLALALPIIEMNSRERAT
jgi:hypothetical protein